MSRLADSHRGAVLAVEAAERALLELSLFPGDQLSPELRREWEGIRAAAESQLELELAMAELRRG